LASAGGLTPGRKVGMVAGGYAVAALLGALAISLRVASGGPDAVSESGMRSFSDLVLGLGVFGAVAIAPTAAALYFLRPYRLFWEILAYVALALSATAVAAAALLVVGSGFAVFRLLLSPLLAGVSLLSSLLSPYRKPKIMLACAVPLEAGAFLFAVLALTGNI
jgi:hypothetical protein